VSFIMGTTEQRPIGDLFYVGRAVIATTMPASELEMLNETRPCGDGTLNGPITCPKCGDAQHTYRLLPRDVPRTNQAELFHITVTVGGPTLRGIQGGCRIINPILIGSPNFWSCQGEPLPSDGLAWTADQKDYDYARYHGSVGGGQWVYGDGQTIAHEYDAMPDVRGTVRVWPDVEGGATPATPTTTQTLGYLVNPNPVWPVPDASGNEIGRCLFTEQQIPAFIDFVLTHHNREASSGTIQTYVGSYLVPEIPPEGDVVLAPGAPGLRRRKMIVGRYGPPVAMG
jgi:hypothetical protein